MIYTQSASSKKYAKAFFNVYKDQITFDQIQSFKLVLLFCRNHNDFLSIIGQLVGRQEGFENLLDEMHSHFELPESVKKLIQVLIKHKKISLFAQILQDIYCLYMLENNLLEVTIRAAANLTEEGQQKLERFFKKLSKKTIIPNFKIDESLIAGVRMESELFLWEHSIKSQIASLSKAMLDEQ